MTLFLNEIAFRGAGAGLGFQDVNFEVEKYNSMRGQDPSMQHTSWNLAGSLSPTYLRDAQLEGCTHLPNSISLLSPLSSPLLHAHTHIFAEETGQSCHCSLQVRCQTSHRLQSHPEALSPGHSKQNRDALVQLPSSPLTLCRGGFLGRAHHASSWGSGKLGSVVLSCTPTLVFTLHPSLKLAAQGLGASWSSWRS